MSERKMSEVNEEQIMRMMAENIPVYRPQTVEKQEPPAPVESPESPEPKKEAKDKKRSAHHADFPEIFLKDNRLSDRRMVYVSKDTYEKLVKYISVISDRKLSIVGYVDNIVSHHIETHKSAINEMYENRIGCKLFKD